jgi:hypothetical protein
MYEMRSVATCHDTCSSPSVLRRLASRSPSFSASWEVSETPAPWLVTTLCFVVLLFFLTITPFSLSLSFFCVEVFRLAPVERSAEAEDTAGLSFVATAGGLDASLCRAATALVGWRRHVIMYGKSKC